MTRRVFATVVITLAASAPAQAKATSAAGRAWERYVTAFEQPAPRMRPKISLPLPEVPDPADVETHFEEYHAAGFGGLVLGFGGATALVDGAFPPSQTEALSHGFEHAKRLGMTLDMPLGAGWPLKTHRTAGDRTSPDHQQELTYGSLDIAGPYTGPLPPGKDMGVPLLTGTASGQEYNPGTFLAAVAGKVAEEGTPPVYHGPGVPYTPGNGDVQFPLTHPAKSTVLDPASLMDITDTVSGGRVAFTPPSGGHWVIFAFYERPTSQDAVNHIRAEAARTALEDLEQGQITPKNLHGFPAGSTTFQDSLELFFAGVPWTKDLLARFRKYRGYDLTPYLPALFVQGAYQTPGYDPGRPLPNPDYDLTGDAGQRVRRDFERTLDDLYADEHLEVFASWAKGIGVRQRAQVAYGTRFDQVRAARELATAGGVVDVEQLNAGDPIGRTSSNWWFAMDLYRAAVSGAHQAGLTELSAETGSTFGRGGYITSLSEARALFDKQMAAGITTPVMTGTWITPASTWPSSNVLFADWNYRFRPEWRRMRALADYWGRGAHVLRTGRPQTDVAIYRDAPTTFAATLVHIPLGVVDHNVDPQLPTPVFHDSAGGYSNDVHKLRNPTPFFDTRPLEERGYTLGYLDPAGLVDRRAAGKGVLYPKGPSYRALVVDQRAMPADAAETLAAESRKGLAVVVVGAPPAAGAGLSAPAQEDARVRAAWTTIMASRRTRAVRTQADVPAALADLGLRPRFAFEGKAPVYSQMRRTRHAATWWMWNAGDKPVTMRGSFEATGTPRVLDLWTGRVTRPAAYRATRSRVELPVTLRPGETKAIAFTGAPARTTRHVTATDAQDVRFAGGRVEVRDSRGGTRTLRFSNGAKRSVRLGDVPEPLSPKTWKLHVDGSDPEESKHDLELSALADWRDIEQLRDVSGVGTYTTTLDVPASFVAAGRSAQLDLGVIYGAVEVLVNGRTVPGPATPDTAYTMRWPEIPRVTAPFDVGRHLRAGTNEITVVVATSLANAVRSRPTTTPDATVVPSSPYGLLGPVELSAVATARVAPPRRAARSCASRRVITIRLPKPLRRATVTVAGKRQRVVRGRRLRARIDLRRLPAGRYVVRIAGRTADGRLLRATRVFRTCVRRGR